MTSRARSNVRRDCAGSPILACARARVAQGKAREVRPRDMCRTINSRASPIVLRAWSIPRSPRRTSTGPGQSRRAPGPAPARSRRRTARAMSDRSGDSPPTSPFSLEAISRILVATLLAPSGSPALAWATAMSLRAKASRPVAVTISVFRCAPSKSPTWAREWAMNCRRSRRTFGGATPLADAMARSRDCRAARRSPSESWSGRSWTRRWSLPSLILHRVDHPADQFQAPSVPGVEIRMVVPFPGIAGDLDQHLSSLKVVGNRLGGLHGLPEVDRGGASGTWSLATRPRPEHGPRKDCHASRSRRKARHPSREGPRSDHPYAKCAGWSRMAMTRSQTTNVGLEPIRRKLVGQASGRGRRQRGIPGLPLSRPTSGSRPHLGTRRCS